jgi:hypothetical protein
MKNGRGGLRLGTLADANRTGTYLLALSGGETFQGLLGLALMEVGLMIGRTEAYATEARKDRQSLAAELAVAVGERLCTVVCARGRPGRKWSGGIVVAPQSGDGAYFDGGWFGFAVVEQAV